MKKRFSEEQIIGFLREVEAGMPVKDLCRRHGVNVTFADLALEAMRRASADEKVQAVTAYLSRLVRHGSDYGEQQRMQRIKSTQGQGRDSEIVWSAGIRKLQLMAEKRL